MREKEGRDPRILIPVANLNQMKEIAINKLLNYYNNTSGCPNFVRNAIYKITPDTKINSK